MLFQNSITHNYGNIFNFNYKAALQSRDVTVWKFLITIIVNKIITVISIITVLLKCAGDVQKSTDT